MHNEKPLVSVQMLTYNHEKYISQAIEGVLMQKTDFPIELIIGEDCSTDNTRKIVIEYAKKFPDIIKPLLHEKNVGAKANDVAVREMAKGKYIAICEGDDYWTDANKLQKQIDYMENNPDCSLCAHAVKVVSATWKPSKRKFIKPYSEDCEVPIEDIIKVGGSLFGTCSLVFTKKIMVKPPEFYLECPIGDLPLMLHLATKGHVYYINRFMATHLINVEGSWSNRMQKSKQENINFLHKLIHMNKKFNEATGYIYSDNVNKKIFELEMQIHILSGNKKILETRKYKNTIKKFSKKKQAKIYLKVSFPRLYNIYKDVKKHFFL